MIRPTGLVSAFAAALARDALGDDLPVRIPTPRAPTTTRSIPVTDLRIGDRIADGKKGVKVRTIDPCTQRGHIHVNTHWCYDLCGYVDVTR